MSCFIAARKGFILDTGMTKEHKGCHYGLFSYDENIRFATSFKDYDEAVQYITTSGDMIGCYAIFQPYHCGMNNRHREMFFVVNKYGFIYNTGKRRTYYDDGPLLNVIRTSPSSRLGTSFKTFQEAESCIQNSLFADEPYVILVPIFI